MTPVTLVLRPNGRRHLRRKHMFAVIGECMVEINAPPVSDDSQTRFPANIGFGGDTLNSAVYLSRAGITVTYGSPVGDDPLSDWLVAAWRRESINTDLEYRIPGSPPGLYMIHVDDRGERSFSYWRKHSPASRLLIVARLIDTGVEELVLKLGADGCRVVHGNTDTRVAPAQAVTVVDSTAAGDSFNAGYLAARITGSTPEQAAVAGNRLAARVIRHRGAILPREQTPELAGGCPEK